MLNLHEAGGGLEVIKTTEIVGALDPIPSAPMVRFVLFLRSLLDVLLQRAPRLVSQDKHEALFRSHLAKHNCFVEFGMELVSFEQKDDSVIAHVKTAEGMKTITCQWMIGTDGAHSVIRKQTGIPFLGETLEQQGWVLGDVHMKWKLDRKVCRAATYDKQRSG